MGRYNLKYGSYGQPVHYEEGEPTCYTDEWKRTSPDYVVYLPQQFMGWDTDNVHFLVTETPKGDLLGFWTQGTYEGSDNECVVAARSTDDGQTWGEPVEIDGPDVRYQVATYASPVVSDSGRIYLLYGKILDESLTAGHQLTRDRTVTVLRGRVSDDDGHTWSDPADFEMRRTRYDSDDPGIPPAFIIWQKPIRDSRGRWIFSYSAGRHGSKLSTPGCESEVRCLFIRFNNLNEGPDLEDLELTFLPESEDGLEAPHPTGPGTRRTWEASLALLPDGRLFAPMTTRMGALWYSVSEDDGATWRETEPLRYRDGGERVLHPASPGPLFALADGRYLLQYHNNEGNASGAPQPLHGLPYGFNRRSLFIAVGEYQPDAHQPIWFSKGKRIADTDGVSAGIQGRNDCATYGSLTEKGGKRILWYPDRKHFLLGKEIPDELLADMNWASEAVLE